MADYIMLRKGRNALSSVMHVVLNVALAVSCTALTLVSGSWWLSALLILLSKWRVVCVQPRYWLVNIKANIVDYAVGLGFVFLGYFCTQHGAGVTEALNIWHIILTLFYIVWLNYIKPQSSGVWPEVQALIAVFISTFALAIITSGANLALSTALAFVVGYGASRHVLLQGEDHDYDLTTFTFGLMLAELNWIFYHWTITYQLPGGTALRLPQLPIVATVASFVFFRGYKSALYHDGKIRLDDLFMPALFALVLIFVMLFFFSEPIFNV